MGLEDFSEEYLTPEVGIVAAAALLLSPPVRTAARRAAISGLAGLLAAGDGIAKVAGLIDRRAGRPTAPGAFVRALAEEARGERARRAAGGQEVDAGGAHVHA